MIIGWHLPKWVDSLRKNWETTDIHPLNMFMVNPVLTWKASFSTVTLPWSLNAEGRKWYWILGWDRPSLLRIKPPASRCAVAHGPVLVRNHLTPMGIMFHHLRERYKLRGCVHSWKTQQQMNGNVHIGLLAGERTTCWVTPKWSGFDSNPVPYVVWVCWFLPCSKGFSAGSIH